MPSVERIEEWIGREVLDRDGERAGKLEQVYYPSDGQGEAVFAQIKSGLLGRRSRLAPLKGATVGRDHVRLDYSAAQLDAASDVEAGDALDEATAQRLAEIYGISVAQGDYESAGSIAERRRMALEAQERAQNLNEEAHARATDAEQAKDAAQDAEGEAVLKSREAEEARTEAEQARLAAPPDTPVDE
jgi:hypothetical protein